MGDNMNHTGVFLPVHESNMGSLRTTYCTFLLTVLGSGDIQATTLNRKPFTTDVLLLDLIDFGIAFELLTLKT